MSVDRLLSIYGQPVQSWPGEEALDEEARANLAALRPQQQPKLRPDETFRGTFLPFRETVDGKHEWAVPGFLQDVWDAATAVRDTSGTGLGPMPRPSQYSPEVFEQILGHGMAGALTGITGNLPRLMVKPPAGTTELGIFGGRNAKTANQEMLAKAEQMAADGVPREDIWKQTGWFQGVDGKWRFEIDDSRAVLGQGKTIGEALAHDPLVSAYPETAGYEFDVGPLGGKMHGSFSPGHADVGIPAVITVSQDGPRGLSSTLHEVQHGVQGIEGFATGANQFGMSPEAMKIYRDIRKKMATPMTLEEWAASQFDGDINAARESYKDYRKTAGKITPQLDRIAQETAVEQAYRRSAGETEARLVQSRRDLTPDQRLANPPWQEGPYGYDVPESQQIVRFGNEGMSNAAKPPLDTSPEARLARAREMGFDTDRKWYHGTKKDFDEFDNDEAAFGMGHWFSDTKNYADWMAGRDGKVIESYVRAKNPYVFDIMEEAARVREMLGDEIPEPKTSREAMQILAGHLEWDAVARDIANQAKKAGHDAVIFKNFEDRPPGWAAGNKEAILVFDPDNIRSVNADFDPSLSSSPNIMASMGDEGGRGAIQQRALDALGYYSAAVEAAKGIKQARGTPEQMLAQLRKVGVKDAEIQATGLDQLFASGKAVTRDQIVDHLEKSRLALNEVVYPRLNPEAVEVMRKNFPDIGEEELARMAKRDETRWSDYSLDPKNPTYQETVLHLPDKSRRDHAWEWFDPATQQSRRFASEAEAKASAPEGAIVTKTEVAEHDVAFHSGHFSEPNIVGHMMTSETVLPGTGQKVFTLDQIQSDWGQRLRDGGVRDEAKIAALEREVEREREKTREFIQKRAEQLKRDIETGIGGGSQGHEFSLDQAKRIVSIDRELMAPHNAEMDRIRAELATARASVSGHPLVNTTDQWTNVVLRRAIRKAAESGADYIAIPTGDTVLSYNPGDAHGMAQFYGRRARDKVAIGDDLEPLPSSESRGAVEGIVPKNLRKLLTKIDKKSPPPQMVDTLDSPSGATGLGQGFTLFPLTDKVKKEVMEGGQPLFSKGGAVAQPTLRRLAQRNAKTTTSVDDALDH